jgi:hypothetical protein
LSCGSCASFKMRTRSPFEIVPAIFPLGAVRMLSGAGVGSATTQSAGPPSWDGFDRPCSRREPVIDFSSLPMLPPVLPAWARAPAAIATAATTARESLRRKCKELIHSTARACNSAYGRRSFGFSNGVLALIWWYFSQVNRVLDIDLSWFGVRVLGSKPSGIAQVYAHQHVNERG